MVKDNISFVARVSKFTKDGRRKIIYIPFANSNEVEIGQHYIIELTKIQLKK